MNTDIEKIFKDKVLGHPAALFVLFFTEMWERFSFYGMRVLLFQFLTMGLIGYNPGWEWTPESAGALFGTYAMMLYITPIIGGVIADKITGHRVAVIIGALIMTLGHVSMALETEFSLYLGLALLVIGTGFFKPTMTSIISEMYESRPEKKDGAYTIYYMGVNAGAFFGMMLCGYLAEKIGWAYGFGLAGIFMLLGTVQFWLAKDIFGSIGGKPEKVENKKEVVLEGDEKRNPFTLVDKILIIVCSIILLLYAVNDPLSKISNTDLFSFLNLGDTSGQNIATLTGLLLFLFLIFTRTFRYTKVVRDRMLVVMIFAVFTTFFWVAFEQGASSLVVFARDNVDRVLSGNSAIMFMVINSILTIIPLAIITYVLYLLWIKTYGKAPISNIVLVVCFTLMWGIVGWMLNRDFNTVAYQVTYDAVKTAAIDEKGNREDIFIPITEGIQLSGSEEIVKKTVDIAEPIELKVGETAYIIHKDNEMSAYGLLTEKALEEARYRAEELGRDNVVVKATVTEVKDNEVEITVSWFSILNSFFIIVFASLFSKWWESKFNPSAASKYALGLIIMALGFGLLAYGAYGVTAGVKVSMVWLILAYLFHTLGELCLSPVSLSFVSKLVPARMVAFMFGVWYLAMAISNKVAAKLGGEIENITKEYSLSTFFLIFTIVPMVAGLLIWMLNPIIRKLMHGVK
jgi:proton-dependent oligopeptide transporter, POT family